MASTCGWQAEGEAPNLARPRRRARRRSRVLPHMDLYGVDDGEGDGERGEPEMVKCQLPAPEPGQPAGEPESRPGAERDTASLHCTGSPGAACVRHCRTVCRVVLCASPCVLLDQACSGLLEPEEHGNRSAFTCIVCMLVLCDGKVQMFKCSIFGRFQLPVVKFHARAWLAD